MNTATLVGVAEINILIYPEINQFTAFL